MRTPPLFGASLVTAVLVASIVGATPVAHADTPAQEENGPSWNCATMGQNICGPTNTEGLPAGCYDNAVLVVKWTRFDDPQADPLYGQPASPCVGMAPTQEQESNAAYVAAQAGK